MNRKARRVLPAGSLIALVSGVCFGAAAAFAGNNVSANLALGQSSLSGNVSAAGQSGLSGPSRLVIDRNSTPNHLYVSDSFNNRVLGWRDITALSNGAPADLVIGQVDFNGKLANQSSVSGAPPTASTLSFPDGLALDALGNLYIGDAVNDRVLEFNAPYAQFNHTCTPGDPCVAGAANLVFGQPDFSSGAIGSGASGMNLPTDVIADSGGNVYISDQGNERVLFYLNPLATGAKCLNPGQPGCAGDVVPDRVFGQGPSGVDYASHDFGVGVALMHEPAGLALDSNGNLYIADAGNHRVLVFDDPTSTASCANLDAPGCAGDVLADAEFGQGASGNNFTGSGMGLSASAFDVPFGVAIDPSNNLYVSDTQNNRVLTFLEPLSAPNKFIASVVFGQGASGNNFGSNSCAPVSATSMCAPHGAVTDARGNLYVADSTNNRVLVFDGPLGNGSLSAPSILKFPSTGVGFASSATIKLINKGSGPLAGSIQGVQSPFKITQGGSFSLAKGQNDPVMITFTPSTAQTFNQNVTVASNDAKHPSFVLKLTGTGVPGTLSAPRTVSFKGTFAPGRSSGQSQTIALRNNGEGVLMVTIGALSGSADFSFATPPPSGPNAIQPKGSLSFMINFSPSGKGTALGTLAIASDDPRHLSASIILKGTGK